MKNNKIKPIPCNIYILPFSKQYLDFKEEHIAISLHSKDEDIQKVINESPFCGDSKTVIMSQKQFDNIFAPLFREISALNAQIKALNK